MRCISYSILPDAILFEIPSFPVITHKTHPFLVFVVAIATFRRSVAPFRSFSVSYSCAVKSYP